MKNNNLFRSDSKFKFESFIVAPINEAAYTAALKVAQSLGRVYNPLFICSGVGQGKTHLLKAIANKVIESNRNVLVTYMQSYDFTNEVIEAIRNNKSDALIDRYEHVDLFLMDGLQYVADKPTTQAGLSSILNVLHNKEKQIVFASDRPSEEIQGLSQDLRSIIKMGLAVVIEPPCIETREAVLRKRADIMNIQLPLDVLLWLAEKETNIRILEYYLLKLDAYAKLKGISITLDLLKNERIWDEIMSSSGIPKKS